MRRSVRLAAGILPLLLGFAGRDAFAGHHVETPRVDIADLALVSAIPTEVMEEEGEDAVLTVSTDGRELRLDGILSEGIADRVAAELAANPDVTGIRLDSPGGLVGEALALGALVAAHGLVTRVSDECASACTLVFVRGRERHVGPRGQLGFHGPYTVGGAGMARASDDAQERNAYINAGLAPEFVALALSAGPDEMWFPDFHHLRGAGVVNGTIQDGLGPLAGDVIARVAAGQGAVPSGRGGRGR